MAWEEAAVKAREEEATKEWEAAKAWEETAAKGAEDALAWPAQETDSPPLSPPREGRTKRMHEPVRQTEADARAGGAGAGQAVGQETKDPHGPATGQTAAPDVPPATAGGASGDPR